MTAVPESRPSSETTARAPRESPKQGDQLRGVVVEAARTQLETVGKPKTKRARVAKAKD